MRKYIIVLVLLVLTIAGLYLYKLHSLSVEANNNFGLRCTEVNPPLIAYKSSFLKFADYIQNPEKYSQDEVKVFYNGYISGMRSYVKEEDKWLETQNKLINRWDYRLIMPSYMKEAGNAQWKMYEAYRNDAQFLLDIGDQKIPTERLYEDSEARQKRDIYTQLYAESYDKVSKTYDWRMPFISQPLPKECNKENLTVPDTSGSIDWEGKEASPSPSLAPVNPDWLGRAFLLKSII